VEWARAERFRQRPISEKWKTASQALHKIDKAMARAQQEVQELEGKILDL
jgi:hypothetical protein